MAAGQLSEMQGLTVLYAEDDPLIRELVSHFLRPKVGLLLTAEDGQEALEMFAAHAPDLVLSDIMMPRMDGLRLAEAIKARAPGTPVIFATAFNDPRFLQDAINVGADGYVMKPIDLARLGETLAKAASALLRDRELTASRAQLESYRQSAEEERRLVGDLMARMMRSERLSDSQLQHWLVPTDIVSGDLIAVARSRNKKLYLMLADSTGHGLPAALNLLPVNHIFYSMVSKNLPVSLIVEEMNWAVKEQSPVDRYVAAAIACVDYHNQVVELWNGGVPPAYFVNADGTVAHTFGSVNLPLGILDRTFTAQTEIYQWTSAGQLVLYSDGFVEAENEAGEPFGQERIVGVLREAPAAERFPALVSSLKQHLGQRRAFDDMTLMVVEGSVG